MSPRLPGSRPTHTRLRTAAASAVVAAAITFTPVVAAPAATAQPASPIADLLLGVGADETQANLAWTTNHTGQEYAQVAPVSAMTGVHFPVEEATTVPATTPVGHAPFTWASSAILTGLAENTGYVYRVGSDRHGWSHIESFTTGTYGDDWNLLFFGDPQIGASGNPAADGESWRTTTATATGHHPDTSLLVSAGDQVEMPFSDPEYSQFFSSPQLRDVRTAVNVGNHDHLNWRYDTHFHLPNEHNRNYFYEYNNALIIALDSNRNNSWEIPDHERFLRNEPLWLCCRR